MYTISLLFLATFGCSLSYSMESYKETNGLAKTHFRESDSFIYWLLAEYRINYIPSAQVTNVNLATVEDQKLGYYYKIRSGYKQAEQGYVNFIKLDANPTEGPIKAEFDKSPERNHVVIYPQRTEAEIRCDIWYAYHQKTFIELCALKEEQKALLKRIYTCLQDKKLFTFVDLEQETLTTLPQTLKKACTSIIKEHNLQFTSNGNGHTPHL